MKENSFTYSLEVNLILVQDPRIITLQTENIYLSTAQVSSSMNSCLGLEWGISPGTGKKLA